jgi:hypothetical protein
MRQLLALRPRPSAVFAASDEIPAGGAASSSVNKPPIRPMHAITALRSAGVVLTSSTATAAFATPCIARF